MRKILESRPGPNILPVKLRNIQEVDISAEISTDPTLKEIGEILLQRQGVGNLFCAAFCKWRSAVP